MTTTGTKKVRDSHRLYLEAISAIKKNKRVTSLEITNYLGRSKSGVETLRMIEALGLIENVSEGRSSDWQLTPQGKSLLG